MGKHLDCSRIVTLTEPSGRHSCNGQMMIYLVSSLHDTQMTLSQVKKRNNVYPFTSIPWSPGNPHNFTSHHISHKTYIISLVQWIRTFDFLTLRAITEAIKSRLITFPSAPSIHHNVQTIANCSVVKAEIPPMINLYSKSIYPTSRSVDALVSSRSTFCVTHTFLLQKT